MNYIQIAIDGPAGAGKSTIAKLVAKELNYTYVDTGAMYRAITLKAMKLGINLDDELAYNFITDTSFEYKAHLLYMDGVDISKEIRETDVSNNVSLVSSFYSVRKQLVIFQKSFALDNNIVMDGRDIGYKVLPNAKYKFYLTATIKKRALRRHLDNLERNIKSDISVIEKEIKRRDYLDTSREHSPLKPAVDAMMLDTSDLSIKQVVSIITKKVREEE